MQKIFWVPMSLSYFQYYILKEEKMHMYFFYLLQGTLIVLLSIFLVALPDCSLLECLALGTEKQCTVVKSKHRSSFTPSGLFAKVLIQVMLKSSLEVVKQGNCKCIAHKITFICFEVYLRKDFHSTLLYC